jgi:NAD-dependent dihydropyrimidine dehydrogenase PreA subunit
MCPLGAMLGVTNKFSMLQMDTNLDECAIAYAKGSEFENCATCRYCSQKCPMNLKVPEEIGSVDCIRCMNCTSYGSVYWRFGPRSGGHGTAGGRAKDAAARGERELRVNTRSRARDTTESGP